MGLFDLFKPNNGFLEKPGDKMSARITDTGREVIKLRKGDNSYSATRYNTGTIVETKVTRPKK